MIHVYYAPTLYFSEHTMHPSVIELLPNVTAKTCIMSVGVYILITRRKVNSENKK